MLQVGVPEAVTRPHNVKPTGPRPTRAALAGGPFAQEISRRHRWLRYAVTRLPFAAKLWQDHRARDPDEGLTHDQRTVALADEAELTAEELRLVPRNDRGAMLCTLPEKIRAALEAKLTEADTKAIRVSSREYHAAVHYSGQKLWDAANKWLDGAVERDMARSTSSRRTTRSPTSPIAGRTGTHRSTARTGSGA